MFVALSNFENFPNPILISIFRETADVPGKNRNVMIAVHTA
jgi:hypothetical protein